MEEFIEDTVQQLPAIWLLGLIGVCLAVLGKSADWLVKEAVALSERSRVPKVVIGATVVSLGTTTPEAAVSVLAALYGDPSLALGNAVGSIICDTGLILGLASLIAPLHLPRYIVNRQGWVQLGSGLLLIVVAWPWFAPLEVFTAGRTGNVSQVAGVGFLVLLVGYLWLSAVWARDKRDTQLLDDLEVDVTAPIALILVKLIVALVLVGVASHVLIPAVREVALRLQIAPEAIAATLVAFGTSLPELVTAVVAARHGHGDLAVGNVVGADILNVLFVAGAAAAVTPAGLNVSSHFFFILFPAMAFILLVFRVGIFYSGDHLQRRFGCVLLGTYLLITVLNYVARPATMALMH